MSVHLVGGGWSEDLAPLLYGPFLDECAARAGRTPRVRLVLMGDDEDARAYHQRFVDALARAGEHHLLLTAVAYEDVCPAEAFDDVDGLFVGGGPTPDYHTALSQHYERIRALVADGLPYAGFSAGAAIAATDAVIGGWRVDGVAVCPEDASEDLDEVTVVEGIELVPGAVDVHAAQWGTLGRLVGAATAGRIESGLALDECTLWHPGDDAPTGAGAVWQVRRSDDGVRVRVLR